MSKIIFKTKLLHAYVQLGLHCISKVSIAELKAVVGVDRPMKALYMHTKAISLGENYLSSHSCHFVKNYFLTKLFHAYVQMCLPCIGKVSNC